MSLEVAERMYQRFRWTTRVRPMIFGAMIADFLASERRTVIPNSVGLKFYSDPLSNLGEELIKARTYEPETEAILRANLKAGDTFLDVGANEGYFSVLAASLGAQVVCVEPQSALCDIIEINLGLNDLKATVHRGALGGKGSCELYRYPSLNTGAASIVRKPKLYSNPEKVPFIDPATLGDSFSFVKVDVEGFEKNVIEALSPLLQQGKIKTLLLDYHASILEPNGVNPQDIHAMILQSGMTCEDNNHFSGYKLYRSAR